MSKKIKRVHGAKIGSDFDITRWGNRLRYLRHVNRLTLYEVSQMTHIPKTTLQSYENGSAKATTPARVRQLAGVYHVSSDSIMPTFEKLPQGFQEFEDEVAVSEPKASNGVTLTKIIMPKSPPLPARPKLGGLADIRTELSWVSSDVRQLASSVDELRADLEAFHIAVTQGFYQLMDAWGIDPSVFTTRFAVKDTEKEPQVPLKCVEQWLETAMAAAAEDMMQQVLRRITMD